MATRPQPTLVSCDVCDHLFLFLLVSRLSFCLRVKMPALDVALILLLNAGRVAAQSDGNVCYILDAILIVYGVVLTVLYCRLKMSSPARNTEKPEGDIYQGLGRRDQDTYETLHGMKKKPPS